jgi:putative transposase
MPRKSKNEAPEQVSVPEIPKELLDQFVTGPMHAEAVDAVMRKCKKAIIERALGGEMTHHLGYASGAAKPAETGNHRNGTSAKTVLTDEGLLRIAIPRDGAVQKTWCELEL